MTDYDGARNLKCRLCGTPFNSEDGPECTCYVKQECAECGGEFNREYKTCLDHNYDDLLEEVVRLRKTNRHLQAVPSTGGLVEAKVKFMGEHIETLTAEVVRLKAANLALFNKKESLERLVKAVGGPGPELDDLADGYERSADALQKASECLERNRG